MDKSGNYTYQNQFAAPLSARAMLGSQVEVGDDDMEWENAHYVGTALTDALLMLNLLTDDWGELGQSLIPEKMNSWVLGKYQWSATNDEDSPYLGCNVDRMGHIPKGVMAIRMDGVDDVTFDGLEIYELQECGKNQIDNDDWTAKLEYQWPCPFLIMFIRVFGMLIILFSRSGPISRFL